MRMIVILMLLIACSGGGSGTPSARSESKNPPPADVTGSQFILKDKAYYQACADLICANLAFFELDLKTEVIKKISDEFETNISLVQNKVNIYPFKNKIYFSSSSSIDANRHLWVYDPDNEIESDVNPRNISKEIMGDIDFNASWMSGSGSHLYFSAFTAEFGVELWSLNCESLELEMVRDIYPGTTGSHPENLIVHNQKIYFVAQDNLSGIEPRIFDTTLKGSGSNPQVIDIHTGSNSSLAKDFTFIGDKLYFSCFDGVNGFELWSLETTIVLSGTNPKLELDLLVGFGSSFPENITSHNGLIYFTAYDDEFGREMRGYNPSTPKGSQNPFVIDMNIGVGDSQISSIKSYGSKIYFTFDDESTYGSELWLYDPAAVISVSNPSNLFDLKTGSQSSQARILGEYDGVVLISAETQNSGSEFWIYSDALALEDTVNPRLLSFADEFKNLIFVP